MDNAGISPQPEIATPSMDTVDPVPPRTRGLLDKIAGTESGGKYDIRYGGAGGAQSFSGYDNHPNVRVPIPNSNLTSDAAGRYQFLSSTWKPIAAKLGFTNFSPQNQDHGASYLASTTYKAATGRDLETDLADPSRTPAIEAALRPQWPSINLTGQRSGTMMASNQQAPAQAPAQQGNLLDMYFKMLASSMGRNRSNIDPAYMKMAMINQLLPQQQQAPTYNAGGNFPWVQAILNGNKPSNALQTAQSIQRMRALQSGNYSYPYDVT